MLKVIRWVKDGQGQQVLNLGQHHTVDVVWFSTVSAITRFTRCPVKNFLPKCVAYLDGYASMLWGSSSGARSMMKSLRMEASAPIQMSKMADAFAASSMVMRRR